MSQTFKIPSTKNYFMVWNWTTMTSNTMAVTLKDTSGTYINNVSRNSTNALPLEMGQSTINGDDLTLVVDSFGVALKCAISAQNLVYPDNGLVASTYTLVAEDATDNDFNDIFFSVTIWKSNG